MVIQLIVIAVGGIATAYGIVRRVETQADQRHINLKNELNQRHAELKAELGGIDKRLILVEQSMKNGSERFGEINTDLRDLRKLHRELELDLVAAGIVRRYNRRGTDSVKTNEQKT
jgi:hypothetical protein